jgi:TatD DNase family protein
LIDSHLHLNRTEFGGEFRDVLDRAAEAGVAGFLNVGYDLATSAESIALAESDPRILATVGVHPHDAAELSDEYGHLTDEGNRALAELESMAAHPRVVAIGEIGLDFFRDLSPRPAQDSAFAAQLKLAERIGLPVVLHVRDAWPETLALVDRVGVPSRGGVLHSFSGGMAEMEWARDRGFLLGIGGPLTYKNSTLPEVVAAAGVDLLLLETDAPWLPPVPYRGKRNEPAFLVHTRARVAEILGTTDEEVSERTTANFRTLFAKGLISG